MEIQEIIVQGIFGFLTSMGFGIITNIPRRILLSAGLTGTISWIAYCILGTYTHQLLWQNLIATIIIGYLGSYFADKYKTTATMIYIPSVVALVPGGIATLSMKSFVEGNASQAGTQLISVFLTAIAIAVGFIVGSIMYKITRGIIARTNIKHLLRTNKKTSS